MPEPQLQVAMSSLENTGVSFEATYCSRLITLEDLEGFFRLLRRLLEAIEPELERALDEEVVLISSVQVQHSSAKANVELKKAGKPWSKSKRAIAEAVIAAALSALPNINIAIETPHNEQISPQCAMLLENALQEHDANARSQRIQMKKYTIRFKAQCEGAYIEATYEPVVEGG